MPLAIAVEVAAAAAPAGGAGASVAPAARCLFRAGWLPQCSLQKARSLHLSHSALHSRQYEHDLEYVHVGQ